MTARLFIIDPWLKSYSGHSYHYAQRLAEASTTLGLACFVFSDHSFQEHRSHSLSIFPWFGNPEKTTAIRSSRFTYWLKLKAKQTLLQLLRIPFLQNKFQRLVQKRLSSQQKKINSSAVLPLGKDDGETHFVHALQRLDQTFHLTREDHLVLHQYSMSHLLGLIHTLKNFPPHRRSTIHVTLRPPSDKSPDNLDYLEPLFQLLRSVDATTPYVRLYADSHSLAIAVEQKSQWRVSLLPVLVSSLTHPLPSHQGTLRATYFGEARLEKGFHLLPSLVRDFHRRQKQLGSRAVEFHIQASGGEWPLLLSRAQLKNFRGSLVTLYETPLSPQAYEALLQNTDIALLPYSPTVYRTRSSGILSEIVALGIPAVVSANSWLAEQLDETRAVFFDSEETFPTALEKLISNYDQYRTAALAYAPEWKEKSSPEKYLETLLAP